MHDVNFDNEAYIKFRLMRAMGRKRENRRERGRERERERERVREREREREIETDRQTERGRKEMKISCVNFYLIGSVN